MSTGASVASVADTYTFGTTPTAAHRLDLLAAVFDPGSRALLVRWGRRQDGDPVEHAVDLGCGPGHTARLLHETTGAARTTAVERSADLAALARTNVPDEVTVVEADVTVDPLPVDPADVVHCRFLVTHLSAPRRALRVWADALRPGGRLVLTEVARLTSREPALGRYYELVAELQDHHGQALDVGATLADVVADAGLTVEHAVLRPWHPPVAEMAALHALNIRTWRQDSYARASFDADELDALEAALVEIARGGPSEPVEQELAEVVAHAG